MNKIKIALYSTHLISILVVFFINGCSTPTPTPSIEQMDKSLFTGDPCAAPCWYSLKIGESSENDVLSTLPTLTFIDPNSIQLFRENSAPGLDPKDANYAAQIIVNCIIPEKQCLMLRTKNYVLTEIEVTLNYEVTLDEAIGYLGTPDYIGYQHLGVAHDVLCELNVIWVSKQLVLASEIFESYEAIERCDAVRETGKLESNLLISKAIYQTRETIEILLGASNGAEFFEFTETNP